MFAKLKPSGGGLGIGSLSVQATGNSPSNFGSSTTSANFGYSSAVTSGPFDQNPILQHFELGRQSGSAGPELVWRIFDAVRRSDGKEASIFFFDKRLADKLHKPKRKETISEILRFGVRQLERFKHPKMLTILHPIEETSDTLAFATECVLGSLANLYDYLEDRLDKRNSGVMPALKNYDLTEFELKYGALQIVEALVYLHGTCRVIHRNISPQSILINKRGTWKLSGLEFVEKCSETDPMNFITCQPYTSKLPKMGQPDLDFTAPEVQTQSICTPLSDMFSLGALLVYLFARGRPLITSGLSTSAYVKQLDTLGNTLSSLNSSIPTSLHEVMRQLLDPDYKRRITSQSLSMVKYFMDSSVHALQYLDIIQMKDPLHKSNFYHNLKNVLPFIPKKMWFQHILPSMECELASLEALAAALQPIIYMINECDADEFRQFILPFIKNIFQMPKSVQATVTLLENIDSFIFKIDNSDFLNEILPMICNAFDSSQPQIQSAAMSALSNVIDHIDEHTVRHQILPKTKQLFDVNADAKVQCNVLICIEKVITSLDKNEILDDVLPILLKAKITDASVLIIVINICKLMMIDTKRYGLTVNILSLKLMPPLVTALANPTLNVDEFNDLVELLTEMIRHITKLQRVKLVQERSPLNLNISNEFFAMVQAATPMGVCPAISMGGTSSPVPTVRTVPPNASPNHSCSSATSSAPVAIKYPHRPPSLRLDARRTSISMDDVVRRSSMTSAASSPDSNLLRVQAHLPGRRHSDNTIQPPRILLAPSSPTTSFSLSRRPSVANLLGGRRHSSIGMQDAKNLLPKIPANFGNTLGTTIGKSVQNAGANLGIESFLSSRSSGRRYSAVPNFDSINLMKHATGHSSKKSKADSGNLLNTIGSGMQQLFSK